MKLTKRQLKRIIREERQKLIRESRVDQSGNPIPWNGYYELYDGITDALDDDDYFEVFRLIAKAKADGAPRDKVSDAFQDAFMSAHQFWSGL